MPNKHIKKCSTCINRELQMKTMRYHSTPIRMTKTQNTDTPGIGEDVGQLSFIPGNSKWFSHFGR